MWKLWLIIFIRMKAELSREFWFGEKTKHRPTYIRIQHKTPHGKICFGRKLFSLDCVVVVTVTQYNMISMFYPFVDMSKSQVNWIRRAHPYGNIDWKKLRACGWQPFANHHFVGTQYTHTHRHTHSLKPVHARTSAYVSIRRTTYVYRSTIESLTHCTKYEGWPHWRTGEIV